MSNGDQAPPVTGFEGLTDPEDWEKVGAQAAAGAFPGLTADTVTDTIVNAFAKRFPLLTLSLEQMGEAMATRAGATLHKLEEPLIPVLAAFIAPILAGLFDSGATEETFASRANSEGRATSARALVESFMGIIAGDADGPIEPDDEPAKRLAAAGVHAAIEGWFNSIIPELISDLLPFEIGHFTGITELPEEVIRALGVGRLVRRAIQPLVNATAVTPMQWAANIKYRPTKLAVSTVVRQFLRGKLDDDQTRNSLARDGYRDEDIDALVNEARKFLDTPDLAWQLWQGLIDTGEAVQTLRDQGYDEQTASKHFLIDGLKREDAIRRELAGAAVTAYVDRRIGDGDFGALLDASIPSARERGLLTTVAQGKRALNTKPLSSGQAASCAKLGIVAVADYRTALEREGYDDDAVYALELLLRSEIDTKQKLADLRARQDADRAAAAKAKADAAAKHTQDVADVKAIKALGPIGLLEDAVIRGVIPLARLEQALNAQFPADTVAVYVADVTDKRQHYLELQQKAADAAKRAANKGLATGELRAALIAGVLSADDVRGQLAQNGLSPADVDVLVRTFQIAADAHAAAVKAHEAAAVKAAQKHLDLAQADALARAGHWTLARYNGFLSSLGFSDVDVAALDELLQDHIDKDRAAAALRKKASTASPAKGLTLEQHRRAVILDLESMSAFQTWLTEQGFAASDIAILVGELADAVTTANAARARRTQATSAVDGRALPLADLTRAAQLGLLAPGDYLSALEARGYSANDAALEFDLLTTEIAGQRTPPIAADSATAIIASSSQAPATTAAARRVAIDGELERRGISLSEAEAGVKKGLLTIDAYQSWLEANGYGRADAELLRALLAAKLDTTGGP